MTAEGWDGLRVGRSKGTYRNDPGGDRAHGCGVRLAEPGVGGRVRNGFPPGNSAFFIMEHRPEWRSEEVGCDKSGDRTAALVKASEV